MIIAVCDDDKTELCRLKQIIENYNNEKYQDNRLKVVLFESGNELIRFLEKKNKIDLLFLDVMLHESNGIDIAKEIRASNNDIRIIFVTSSPDYAVDSYEVDACYYLMKPFPDKEIKILLDKAINIYITDIRECLIFSQAGKTIRIFYNNIIYIECVLHKLYFHLYNGNIISCYGKIKDCSKELLPKIFFIQCHKSFIVNMNYVSEISKKDFILPDKSLIPISKQLYREVSNKYIDYIFNKGQL